MPIDPKIEAPTRKLLGHAIRDETADLYKLIVEIGPQAYEAAIALVIQASAYVTIDVGKRWPGDADLREAARIAATAKSELPVTEDEIHMYLSRVTFGFESLAVFSDAEKASVIPLFTLARLLIAFTPDDLEWPAYLDMVWNSIDAAEQTPLPVLPALLYRHRALAPQGGKIVRPSTS